MLFKLYMALIIVLYSSLLIIKPLYQKITKKIHKIYIWKIFKFFFELYIRCVEFENIIYNRLFHQFVTLLIMEICLLFQQCVYVGAFYMLVILYYIIRYTFIKLFFNY